MTVHDLKSGITTDRLPDGLNISAALGNFDGVHIGHASLISMLMNPENKGVPSVWYISDLPSKGPLLSTEEDKLDQFGKLGIRYAISENFENIRDLSPDDFFRSVLIDRLNCRTVACGFNFSFGKHASGSASDLERLSDIFGISCMIAPPYMFNGSPVSSSRIRSALSEGDTELAASMLGRRYSISSSVKEGDGIGRDMGFPTVNFELDPAQAFPKPGVYASLCMGMPSVTNIGTRPTVTDGDLMTCETHIIDFSGDIYGKRISVEFIKRLRDERKFNNIEELSEQIERDVKIAGSIISDNT